MTSLSRRTTVLVAGAALAFSLASVPTAFVATAAAAADLANCGITDSRTDSYALPTYTSTHSVVGDGTVAPGGTVTLRTKVSSDSSVGVLVDEIRQHHPAGFVPVSARVESHKAIFPARHTWVDENVVADASNNISMVQSNGWSTGLGQRYVTAEITYKAPEDVSPGEKFATGAGFDMIAAENRTYNPMDVCVTVREKNPVESVQGSLEGIGAGSLVEGSVSSSDVASDPAGSVADIINDLDFGQLIGGAIGS